jgi:PAS domain S-box-containing protein
MNLKIWLLAKHPRASQACGMFVILISIAALIGWFSGSTLLKAINSAYIPMAPNTAVAFALLGLALIVISTRSRRLSILARVATVIAAILVVSRMSEYLTSLEFHVDQWIFRFPSDSVGLAPVGKMALLTALTFLLLITSIFLFTVRAQWALGIGHGLSMVVAFIGTAFCLGYLYGAPLMYNGRSIPMALNTAICFVLAGSALVIKGSCHNAEARHAARLELQHAHDELEERVRARTAQLAEQQQYLQAIVEASPNPIFVKDSEGRFTLINKAVELAYGRPANEILGKKETELNGHHAEIQIFIQDDAEVIRTRRPKFIFEEELTNPTTGEARLFQTIKVPLKVPGNGTVHVLGVATDITERKRTEQTLRETEERYRLLFDSNPLPMWVYDRDTLGFLAINDAAVSQYGYSRDEFLSMTIKDIRALEDVEDLLANISDERGFNSAGTWKHKRKDGSSIDVEIISHPLTLSGKDAKLVLANDVTERKKAEEALRDTEDQLRQAQKLEGVGRLAGGIAHDFNNLLTVINGFSALAMRDLKPEDPLFGNLEEVKKAGDRAASLTRQLLAFSRRQVLQPKILNLDTVVADMEKMLRRIIGENIDLRAVLEPTLGNVNADPGQIEQIILNLVVNARDSMPAGGKLTIETDNVYLDEEYVREHVGAQSGRHVMLAVTDTGHGMDQETIARIFEPFFTTKETGKGTGLGLSTVYGIVKQSGGNIWVYSEVGRGTTFKVYLPRVDDDAEICGHRDPAARVTIGNETILLVEDEEMLRKLGRQTLKGYGYEILEAANGDEAITLAARHEGTIHLLLTDVIMPGMSGREVATRLLESQRSLKVLFMSGYTDDAIVHQGVLDESANFIQKPFSPDQLACKVRAVLDQEKHQA